MSKDISRITKPIPGMFALIWMQFSWWIDIQSRNMRWDMRYFARLCLAPSAHANAALEVLTISLAIMFIKTRLIQFVHTVIYYASMLLMFSSILSLMIPISHASRSNSSKSFEAVRASKWLHVQYKNVQLFRNRVNAVIFDQTETLLTSRAISVIYTIRTMSLSTANFTSTFINVIIFPDVKICHSKEFNLLHTHTIN